MCDVYEFTELNLKFIKFIVYKTRTEKKRESLKKGQCIYFALFFSKVWQVFAPIWFGNRFGTGSIGSGFLNPKTYRKRFGLNWNRFFDFDDKPEPISNQFGNRSNPVNVHLYPHEKTIVIPTLPQFPTHLVKSFHNSPNYKDKHQ